MMLSIFSCAYQLFVCLPWQNVYSNPLPIFFLFFWPHHVAWGVLVPHPGTEPVPSAVKVQSLNHWTAREFSPIFVLITLFILAALGLHCCAWAFSSCTSKGYSSLWSTGSRRTGFSSCGAHKLSSCGARAQLLRGMWDLPRPGLEPLSPALAGGFLTTAPPGKCPPPFQLGCLVMSCRSSFYKLDIKCLLDIRFSKTCSLSVSCLFTLDNVP